MSEELARSQKDIKSLTEMKHAFEHGKQNNKFSEVHAINTSYRNSDLSTIILYQKLTDEKNIWPI